jgi:hypothetical protein
MNLLDGKKHRSGHIAGFLFSFFITQALFVFSVPVSAQDTIKSKTTHDTSGNYNKSERFYDSVYRKLQKRKFEKMLYSLAFKPPPEKPGPSLETPRKSESPFIKYSGKVIREIRINTLPAFGYYVYDSLKRPRTNAAKVLNSLHVTTQNFVIRKELMFKQGETVDPNIMAESERLIRDMEGIDDVNFIVTETSPGSDSVDVLVITKDVWSIGGFLNSLTTHNLMATIFDGNFLGLGDRLTLKFSMDIPRAPFFMINGVNYIYTNIAGSFIDGLFGFTYDYNGNQTISAGLQRGFYSNQTIWAGGAFVNNIINIEDQVEAPNIVSRYSEGFLWLGRAYPVPGAKKPTRFIIAESFLYRNYSQRPYNPSFTDPFYLNVTRFLTGVSVSRNNYLISQYIKEFGKPESIPYGTLAELVVGPSFDDLSSRVYTGITFSAGTYLKTFGYLSGRLSFGGYFNKSAFQDALLKVSGTYFTNLVTTPNNRYKFRTFVEMRYGLGFNRVQSISDFYNLNNILQVSERRNDSLFQGVNALGLRISTIAFTPWYFYGFAFALTAFAEVGVASLSQSINNTTPFFGGFGIGIKIKNDNLIFPAFLISCAIYPGLQPDVPLFQVEFKSNYDVYLPDFNATYPGVQRLYE